MDLDSCVLNVSAAILAELHGLRAVSLGELHEFIAARVGDDAKHNFAAALSLLYAVGVIDYDVEADAIVFLGARAGLSA
jgi:hypothetical protein